MTEKNRSFLFLQGPHGPFFKNLATFLETQGYKTSRINFNGGDWVDWHHDTYKNFTGTDNTWKSYITSYLDKNSSITDIVLYGDCRPFHKIAINIAQKKGLKIHVFEEGYLRPNWITYERGGVNANSSIFSKHPEEIINHQVRQDSLNQKINLASSHRKKMKHQFSYMLFFCVRYYLFMALLMIKYPNHQTHRKVSPVAEFFLWNWNILLYPLHKWQDYCALKKIDRIENAYFLLTLQLDNDYQVRQHSPYDSMLQVIDKVISSFSTSGHDNTSLVIKNHPLDNSQVAYSRYIKHIADKNNIDPNRIIFLHRGKLKEILQKAQGVIAINSTAGLQAGDQGVPVKVLGKAIYDIPGIATPVELDKFWHAPGVVDKNLHKRFKSYLLDKNQFFGSFYLPSTHHHIFTQLVDNI